MKLKENIKLIHQEYISLTLDKPGCVCCNSNMRELCNLKLKENIKLTHEQIMSFRRNNDTKL